MVKKARLFAFDEKMLKKRRDAGCSSNAERLPCIPQRWQENVPNQFRSTWFWFRSIKFSGPEGGLAAKGGRRLALEAHPEDGHVSRWIGHGCNQKTLDRIAQT